VKKLQKVYYIYRMYTTSPNAANSMTMKTGGAEQTPISRIMCGWSNWSIVSNQPHTHVCGVV